MTPIAIHPSILRAYDIRGIVGATLNAAAAKALGHAFASVVRRDTPRTGKARPAVAVGFDGRLSSPDLEAALADGLATGGVDVVRIGMGPTPMLYFAVHALDLDGGVMVTGSHNPPEFNGLKIMLGKGPFFGAQIEELGSIVGRGLPQPGDGPGVVVERVVRDRYVDRLAADARMERPLGVVWDAGNGAVGAVLADLVARLPGRHTTLFAEVDGSFPNHHPDPTVPQNLEALIETVRREGADLGVAFDGDGDRIGVVDGEGGVLWGDQLMTIWAADVLAERPGATIIADVKASQVLFDEIARLGGTPLMWKTGHSLIKQKLKETGAPLAGEISGHIFFADRYYGFDDALYAAIRLLNALSIRDRSLAEIRRGMPAVVNTPELRFDCDDERKFAVIDEVRAGLDGRTDVIAVDGVRVPLAGGWWLLRASNTQPVLVARCEGPDQASLETIKRDLVAALEPFGIVPPGL